MGVLGRDVLGELLADGGELGIEIVQVEHESVHSGLGTSRLSGHGSLEEVIEVSYS